MKFVFLLAALIGSVVSLPTHLEKIVPRIVGGGEAVPHSIPYQVGIILAQDGHHYFCGGSLISKEFILTAAHCAEKTSNIDVLLGAHDMGVWQEKGMLRFTIEKQNIIIHPEWDSDKVLNDIALLKLSKPIEYTDSIKSINLPRRSQEKTTFGGDFVTVSGWGRYTDKSQRSSSVLRYAEVTVMPNERCSRYFPYRVTPTNICSSGSTKSGACEGDSGGPLAIQDNDGSNIVIGVVSMVANSGCENGYPSIYSRVTSYLDWISKETGIAIRA